jgi:hypothetical protein
MNLSAWFGVAFLLGVAGAVYFLSRGAERRSLRTRPPRVDEFGRESGPTSISVAVPTLAGGFITFGLIGYVSSRALGWTAPASLGAATVSAVVAGIAASRVLAGWAGYAAHHDVPDERFVLQGHVAKVVSATDGRAAVEYIANGRTVVAPARSVGETTLHPGSEVVIDRVEEGIVYVEDWSHVEQRI